MAILDQFWEFLNSPIGLLLCGFLFTTVVGTILTARYKQAMKEQEFRFIKLHEDRAKAIRTLHEKTVDVEEALFNLLYNWRPVGLYPPKVNPKEVEDKVREFRKLSEKYSIYFSPELCTLINSLCKTFESTWRNMEQAILKNRDNPEFDEEAATGVHNHSRNVKTKLQEEFKKILGSKRKTRFFKFMRQLRNSN